MCQTGTKARSFSRKLERPDFGSPVTAEGRRERAGGEPPEQIRHSARPKTVLGGGPRQTAPGTAPPQESKTTHERGETQPAASNPTPLPASPPSRHRPAPPVGRNQILRKEGKQIGWRKKEGRKKKKK